MAGVAVGLSLMQPWATLIAIGAKRIETRSWPTRRRGPFFVHASVRMPTENLALCRAEPVRGVLAAAGYGGPEEMPRGAVVGWARIVGCELITPDLEPPPLERAVDHFAPGRWAWYLEEPRRIEPPVPARGMLGFWPLPDEVERLARERMRG